MISVKRKGNKVQVELPTGATVMVPGPVGASESISCASHAEVERPARIPTAYLVFLGDRTSLVNPEFGSRQCAHNELDRDMRD
jgi:hypothetical protein